jgi:hypothetical protein
MRKKKYYIWIFLVLFPFLVFAQEQKPLVGILPFTVRGIQTGEAGLIESLIRSYMEDLGNNVVFLEPDLKIGASYNAELFPSPEYILSGSIISEGENRIFILELAKPATGEQVLYTSTHRSLSDLALKARSLVVSALNAGTAPAKTEIVPPEQLTVNKLAGTWRGGTEILLVRLRRDSVGTAIFTSGAQMNLTYTIEDNTLKVFQNSPNTERFYHPLPYQVAGRLSAEAEPMRWEFQLYEKGRTLRGKRIGTGVRYEGNRILELIHGIEQPEEWTKYGR